MKGLILCIIYACLVALVAGDCYMQNPRGSNNRLNEASTDADNQARLFSSENNAQGGYCWGPPMSFYTGSELSIEWTSQHGCGSSGIQCNVVIQYMCADDNGDPTKVIRDGTTTTTIPDDSTYNTQDPITGAYTYGMHEPYTYYQSCAARSRNMGLFTADQQMNNPFATATRQNNNGGRSGFECQEERDYYPYWHPSPWKDIAVLVDNKNDCSYFKQESQNVQSKNYCSGSTQAQQFANTQQSCLSVGGQWMSQGSWGISAPDCYTAPWNRDNHLGNGQNGFTNSYNWTLPTSEPCLSGSCSCVLRIRYNISTPHTQNWPSKYTDSTANGANSPVKTNPYVMIGTSNVSLALNTAQYGRTFQDRSFVWKLINRPSGFSKTAKIYNLNVRGKRGNIVETYPATEYDFVPTQLSTTVGDYVHFQWTGCDTNPGNNAGEGIAGTDRSNIVQIATFASQIPLTDAQFGTLTPMFGTTDLRYRMAHIDQVNCLDYADLYTKNGGNTGNMNTDPQNCMKLNGALTPYFNGGLIKMNTTGSFYYMSSRNNNFSNRTQKGVLIVNPLLPPWAIALIVIGAVAVTAGAAVAGSVFYAKKHPHSRIAQYVAKVPLINRI